MTGFKATFCRFCLENITDKGFQIIDNVTRDILDVLLPKLNFCGEGKDVICNACQRKLNATYVFKSTCLNTNNAIISHVNHEKVLHLDLGEIYVNKNGIQHLIGVSCTQSICRLCMQQIKGEIRCIGEEELEAIHKFVPEINILIVKDPVICIPCFDSLCTHNTFLKDIFESLASENKMDTSVLLIKTEYLDEENKIKEENISIKTECIDIKLEEDGKGSDMLLLGSNNETFGNSDCRDADNNCIYETESKTHLMAHSVKHKDVSNAYQCHACVYKSRFSENVTRHQLVHKDPSEARIYRCNDCDYKTIHRGCLIRHTLRHKDTSQWHMYKCYACDYESRYKNNIINHELKHKDPSEVQMYKCNDCDYKTVYKPTLARHILQHKDRSQVQMYKCDACDFEGKYKNNLIKHKLTHKDPSEVQMYECNDCNYTTKFKFRIRIHALKHKDPSHTQMHKCDTCTFETKYRKNLIRHKLLHKA